MSQRTHWGNDNVFRVQITDPWTNSPDNPIANYYAGIKSEVLKFKLHSVRVLSDLSHNTIVQCLHTVIIMDVGPQ